MNNSKITRFERNPNKIHCLTQLTDDSYNYNHLGIVNIFITFTSLNNISYLVYATVKIFN